MKTYAVIGLGRFGSCTARELSAMGNEVLAIDTDPELVQRIVSDVTNAVVADGQDKEVLRALGMKNIDCAIVAIGEELGASVLITMNLKELGVPYVVCKAHDETHRKVLEKLGADKVVIPEHEQATKLARSLSSPNVLDYIELSGDYAIIDVPAPRKWIGRSLKELDVRAKLGLNIIAVKRNGKISTFPAGDYRFETGDVIVVLGDGKTMSVVEGL